MYRSIKLLLVVSFCAIPIGALDSSGRLLSAAAWTSRIDLEEEAFIEAIEELRDADLATISELVSGGISTQRQAVRERARIDAIWAEALLSYPFLHWRESAETELDRERHLAAVRCAIDFDNPAFLDIEEHLSMLQAWLHMKATALMERDSRFSRGDNRLARAKYEVITHELRTQSIRERLLFELLTDHVAANGSRHVENLLERFAGDGYDSDLVARLESQIAAERLYWEGYEVEDYLEAQGVQLQLHIRRPQAEPSEPGPAILWFHEGAFTNGAWYWCPSICSDLVEKGYTVVQVEYRTADRFNSTPFESVLDVLTAIDHVRDNARRLDIDPEQIITVGPAAGGTLAMMSATFPDYRESAGPDAAISIAGCADPRVDGWFLKSVGIRNVRPITPTENVRAGIGPLLAIHGTADQYCPHGDVRSFVDSMRSAGNSAELVSIPDASHRLIHQDGSAGLISESIAEFLETEGFPPPALSPR